MGIYFLYPGQYPELIITICKKNHLHYLSYNSNKQKGICSFGIGQRINKKRGCLKITFETTSFL